MEDHITKYFRENIHTYLEEEELRKELLDYYIVDWFKDYLKQFPHKPLRILEVGGASGQLLKQLRSLESESVEVFDLELISQYKDYLCDRRINFINASIFDNYLKDNYFDCVICRYGLHHFVSSGLKASLKKQKQAVSEMVRLLKRPGILIIEEELVNNNFTSALIYLFSRLAARFKLRIGKRLRSGIIVYFFSRSRLLQLVAETHGNYEILAEESEVPPMPFLTRLLFLFQKIRLIKLIIKIK